MLSKLQIPRASALGVPKFWSFCSTTERIPISSLLRVPVRCKWLHRKEKLLLSVTKILLRHGARVDDRDDGGETALLIAAQRENGPAVIQELTAAGADIHAVNEFAITR